MVESNKNVPHENALYSHEIRREGGEDVLYVNYFGAPFVPSLVDSPEVMERTVDALIENPNVSRIIFAQQKNYNYDFNETTFLLEIANLYNHLLKQERVLSKERLAPMHAGFFPKRYMEVFSFLTVLKKDPILAYAELKRIIIQAKIFLEKLGAAYASDQENYLGLLNRILGMMEKTRLIQEVKPYLDDYRKSDREIYNKLFRPDTIPNFTLSRLISDLPRDAEIVDQYEISNDEYDKSVVTILKRKDDSKLIYHVVPPENALSEDHNTILNLARRVLVEHQPKADEFTDTERTRQVFFNVSRDLLQDLAQNKGVKITYSDLNKLAMILVRHTIGFGIIEILLQDKKIQDITLNAPISMTPIFIRHQSYDECVVNVIPSQEDVDSWAAKFRLVSGRPLDEANPILDTQLEIGKIRARIAIIQRPLSPDGISYAIRRHREEPWTFPLFTKNKMINPLAAGLMSFLVDGSRTMLIAGTRSSGKTSLLGSLMLEIIPKYRIITIEDSVSGKSKIIINRNGKYEKISVGELIDEQIEKHGNVCEDGRERSKNIDKIKVFSVDKKGKIVLSLPSQFIRHKTGKQMYEVLTTSGKKIRVTEDHSLFTLDERSIYKSIKTKNIKKGNYIAIPSYLPFKNSLKQIDLIKQIDKFNVRVFVRGKSIEDYLVNCRKDLFKIGYLLKYKKSVIQSWARNKLLPVRVFSEIRDNLDCQGLELKTCSTANGFPINFDLDENFLKFVGLWLADGCYDKRSIIVSVKEKENREVVKNVSKKLGLEVKNHKDGFSLMINSVLLKEFMQNILNLEGNSFTKTFPDWVYNLSNKDLGYLLNGFFSGDGCVSKAEVLLSLRSKELIEGASTLLLRYGIVARVSEKMSGGGYLKEKKPMYDLRIGCTKKLNKFKENVGFLTDKKSLRLNKLCCRVSTHDTANVIPLLEDTKKKLKEILGKSFNKHDYITRENNIGRNRLIAMLENINDSNVLSKQLKNILNADLFWDKVKDVRKINSEGIVYDISVPRCENFICENILAHNSLELPVESLRKLKYDILRMKVRSALLKTTTEVSADDGIRTSLRLGDSCLIVGEVRSLEAQALYEAMRVGALANVVAGTIHGASPYAVFDRVVNDLDVPATSFKATDIIVVANPIKTPDGLHSLKRVVSISEVRKHWTKDPLEEKGFVDLMRYNVETDELEPTEDLINGDSEVIKDIASNVKGWAGNWDAVWDNILLRAKINETLVKTSEKMNNPELLESGFSTRANHAFHRISDEVRQEFGLPLSEEVFPLWEKWLEGELRKRGK
ncbi:MAG: Flp pilus assembly complex ATPase component TadA [Nanoarchaeota archaeon]|nr:Flp pilus assembly complex ATPase component TadA [Nanoarchaeota archaeon]